MHDKLVYFSVEMWKDDLSFNIILRHLDFIQISIWMEEFDLLEHYSSQPYCNLQSMGDSVLLVFLLIRQKDMLQWWSLKTRTVEALCKIYSKVPYWDWSKVPQVDAADTMRTGYFKVTVVWKENILDGRFFCQHSCVNMVKWNVTDHEVFQLIADR